MKNKKNYQKNDDSLGVNKKIDRRLETGDCGAICNDQLIITGRKKELIIVNGQNYFPNDTYNLLEKFLEKNIFEIEKELKDFIKKNKYDVI